MNTPDFSLEPKKSKTSDYNSNPLFSIGLTTYNRPLLLRRSIDSILNQTFVDFELIVGNDYVDGPLSRETLGIDDARVIILNHSENLGEIGNMNALLHHGRGQYFMWQFDDDLYAEHYLEAVYTAILKYDSPSAILTSFTLASLTEEPDLKHALPGPSTLLTGNELLSMYWQADLKVMAHAGVYHRAFLVEQGGVDKLSSSPFGLFSEYLLLIRTGLLERIAYIDSPLAIYRVHEQSWSSSTRDPVLLVEASRNLVKESWTILRQPPLRNNFDLYFYAVLKHCIKSYLWEYRIAKQQERRLNALTLWLRLGVDSIAPRDPWLCLHALNCWIWVGAKQLFWPVLRAQLPIQLRKRVWKFAHEMKPK